jgi:translation initiation factor 1
MAKKTTNTSNAFVYSTDPGFKIEPESREEQVSIAANLQKIRVKLETKHRGGKAVTLIDGFIGTDADKEELGKKLKTMCGTGGSVKGDEILIQGDNREKIVHWLLKNGYTNTKKG